MLHCGAYPHRKSRYIKNANLQTPLALVSPIHSTVAVGERLVGRALRGATDGSNRRRRGWSDRCGRSALAPPSRQRRQAVRRWVVPAGACWAAEPAQTNRSTHFSGIKRRLSLVASNPIRPSPKHIINAAPEKPIQRHACKPFRISGACVAAYRFSGIRSSDQRANASTGHLRIENPFVCSLACRNNCIDEVLPVSGEAIEAIFKLKISGV